MAACSSAFFWIVVIDLFKLAMLLLTAPIAFLGEVLLVTAFALGLGAALAAALTTAFF